MRQPRRTPRPAWTAAIAAFLLVVLTPAVARAQTVVSLTFDDGVATQSLAAAELNERGMDGTFYVNTSRVGTAGRLSWADLATMRDAGHEIGGHTVTHQRLTTLPVDEIRREVCHDRSRLVANGHQARSFAYPNGAHNTAVRQVVQACGYASGRSTRGLAEPAQPLAEPLPLPAAARYAIRTPPDVETATTQAQLRKYVTDAEAAGGGWVNIVFHNVCNGCDPYSITAANLDSFLSWLAPRAATGTTVKTVSDVAQGTSSTLVPAAPWRIPPEGSNAVTNPSLESDSDADGTPDCVVNDGFGTSTPVWTRVNDARTGAWGYRLQLTAFTDGDRKISIRRDLGSCAPAVSPGRSYLLSGWYKSSVPVRLVAYGRDATGVWSYLDASGTFPASAAWAQATLTPPPIPDGVESVSFGVTLAAVGTVTVDDLAVDDTTITPPASTITCDGQPCTAAAYTDAVRVAIDASDLGSGLEHVIVSSDGGPGAPYTGPLDLTETTTVRWRAVDRAGNVEDERTQLITVVPAPPEVPEVPDVPVPQPPVQTPPAQTTVPTSGIQAPAALPTRTTTTTRPTQGTPRVRLASSSRMRVKGRNLTLRLQCTGPRGTCRGRVQLKVPKQSGVARAYSAGSASYTIRAGKHGEARIVLPKRTAQQLKRRKLKVVVTLRPQETRTATTATVKVSR